MKMAFVCFAISLLFTSPLTAKPSDQKILYSEKFINQYVWLIGGKENQGVMLTAEKNDDFSLYLIFINESEDEVFLDPEKIIVKAFIGQDEGFKEETLKIYSSVQYLEKLKSQQNLKSVLLAFSQGLESGIQNSHTNYSTVTGHTSSGQMVYGTAMSGPSFSDRALLNAKHQEQTAALRSQLSGEYQEKAQNLLYPQNIFPKSTYGGTVHVKWKKAHHYEVTVPYADNTYVFRFKLDKNKKLASSSYVEETKKLPRNSRPMKHR